MRVGSLNDLELCSGKYRVVTVPCEEGSDCGTDTWPIAVPPGAPIPSDAIDAWSVEDCEDDAYGAIDDCIDAWY